MIRIIFSLSLILSSVLLAGAQEPRSTKISSSLLKVPYQSVRSKDSSYKKFLDSLSKGNGEFVSNNYYLEFKLEPRGWTSDYEHVFNPQQIAELDSIIERFEKETGNEIAVVTLVDWWISESDFDNFIIKLANDWGVGKKGLDNGVVIALSTGLRKIRINNGYGIEKMLSNIETKRIIDEIIIPEFRKDNYFVGVKNGLLAIMSKIR